MFLWRRMCAVLSLLWSARRSLSLDRSSWRLPRHFASGPEPSPASRTAAGAHSVIRPLRRSLAAVLLGLPLLFSLVLPAAVQAENNEIQMSFATRSIAEFGAPSNPGSEDSLRVVVEIGDGAKLSAVARTINYTVGGSADRGDGKDYTIDGCTSSPCTVILPANRHSAVIPIDVINDGIDENDETIVFTLQEGIGYTVNSNLIPPGNLYTYDVTTVTIRDDDTRGLTFHRRWADVDEGFKRHYNGQAVIAADRDSNGQDQIQQPGCNGHPDLAHLQPQRQQSLEPEADGDDRRCTGQRCSG